MPKFPSLTQDLEVDVVVIGAGLTGITAAHLFKASGAKVALIDRGRCAGGDTGHTTSHLTYVTDYRLNHLVKTFGKDGAKAFWEAGVAALDQIHEIVSTQKIDCDFKRVPGYLHARIDADEKKDIESLKEDASLARELGFDAQYLDETPMSGKPGVRFTHQAKFHPLKYLSALVKTVPGNGSHVFEESEATEVSDDPLTVTVGRYKIRCKYLMIATHTPLMGKSPLLKATLFQTKLALYTSYVLGARLPSGRLPEGLFWDTNDPYYYVRVDKRPENDYIIFGGKDIKTGQEKDTEQVFKDLQDVLMKLLPETKIEHRWMGQVVETNDGLPFIGENSENQFVATGFCGNGFTLGTLSATMARDRFLKKPNPWFELFNVKRKKFHGGTWQYIKENLDYPYYMLRDRLAKAEGDSVEDLKVGEGKLIKLDGKKTAAFREEDGKVSLVSPVCTHLKCIVHWNAADKTWDCPCHGSRFHPTGEVLSGPAEEPLEKMPWPEKKKDS